MWAVERAREAVADLRENVSSAGVAERVTVWEGDATRPPPASLNAPPPERVVLDPPREGARAVVPTLIRLRPATVVYVSCDVATLGRDLTELGRAGYALREAIPFDAFPETPHLETLAILVRET